MKYHGLIFAALLVACTFAHASPDEDWQASRPLFNVAVDINAQGVAQNITPQGNVLTAEIAKAISQTVSGWSFQTPVVNGKPATAHTYLEVQAETKKNGDKLDVRFSYLGNGPLLGMNMSMPRYPEGMRGPIEAALVYTATVNPDGRITDVRLESARTTGGKPAAPFNRSVEKSLAKLRAQPITVDGAPISSRIRLPMNFTLHHYNPATLVEAAEFSGGLLLAVDSPATPTESQPAGAPMRADSDSMITLDSPIALKQSTP